MRVQRQACMECGLISFTLLDVGQLEAFYRRLLPRVVLDNELVVDLYGDLVPLRKPCELSGELIRVLLEVGKIERRMTKEAILEVLVAPGLLLEGECVRA